MAGVPDRSLLRAAFPFPPILCYAGMSPRESAPTSPAWPLPASMHFDWALQASQVAPALISIRNCPRQVVLTAFGPDLERIAGPAFSAGCPTSRLADQKTSRLLY